MNSAPDREALTWQAFGEATRDLAGLIAGEGFEPDLILAIARGGLPLAAALGYALAVKDLHTVNVEFYDGVGSTLAAPVMLPPVPDPSGLAGRRVLIADDVADTGRTLQLVHAHASNQARDVRTVVLYEKPQSEVQCDYVWKRTRRWVNFPWSCDGPVVRREGQVLDA